MARSIGGIEARSWVATHPFVVDLAIATTVAVAPLVFEATDAGEAGATLDAVDWVASAIAFALILLRRRAPVPVLAVAVVAAVWSLLPADDQSALQVTACLVLYTVATASSRRTAWTAGGVTAAAMFVTATVSLSGPWYEHLELIAWPGIATAVGDAVRSRRGYLIAMQERAAALQERAERAEEMLEEEARRRVVEERLRIARELHDVVAHHIAVISVQAGVATHLVHDDPFGAEEALMHVRRGANDVLDELGTILSVMRQPDDPETSTDPLPTLDQLDQLVSSFNQIGLAVEWHTAGVRRDVAPGVGLAAYRVVQESLTNAHRHGRSPRACLRLEYQPDRLTIEVLNDAAPGQLTAQRAGHGIVGMRERVAAAGGMIEVGSIADDRFRVRVSLPLAGDDR